MLGLNFFNQIFLELNQESLGLGLGLSRLGNVGIV